MDTASFYNLLMVFTFCVGYFLITIENMVKINKTSIALMMGILCWIFEFAKGVHVERENLVYLSEHIASISQVIFFLLGALAIVEVINAHKGFKVVSEHIKMKSPHSFLWMIGIVTFFLSAVLDNLTTTIIMVSFMQKIMEKGTSRLLVGGVIVIAANAGGAWTPIGDVTTTMLWIGGQLSTFPIMRDLFLPSIAALIVSLIWVGFSLKKYPFQQNARQEKEEYEPLGKVVFWLGIACLVSVPLFKAATGLPPFMGIIFGMGILWLFTDFVHGNHQNRSHLLMPHVMTKIDVGTVLFFLGILLAVDALYTAGILHALAVGADNIFGSPHLVAIVIGLASAIVDNVPLVAATMGMYTLKQYPMDSSFWQLIAYCAGTGGSILVIGSAAGVAFMGLEKVQFFWYFRQIGIPALVGYFAGIGVYFLFM